MSIRVFAILPIAVISEGVNGTASFGGGTKESFCFIAPGTELEDLRCLRNPGFQTGTSLTGDDARVYPAVTSSSTSD